MKIEERLSAIHYALENTSTIDVEGILSSIEDQVRQAIREGQLEVVSSSEKPCEVFAGNDGDVDPRVYLSINPQGEAGEAAYLPIEAAKKLMADISIAIAQAQKD